MLAALRRTMRDQVANLGLSGPATRVYRAVASGDPRIAIGNARFRRQGAPDGLPIPPSDLRFSVAGTTSISWFLEGGARAFGSIHEVLRRNGVALEGLGAVLGPKAHGSDYDSRLVDWCNKNLNFAEVRVN